VIQLPRTVHPPRRIFDRGPASWRDLQTLVAQVFSECGCEASCGVVATLPRGRVELDVFVRDRFTTPHSNYICECKNWARPVSQSAVHSFRTVVTELGANRGFLISRDGFQPGAREAARFTNIDLLSWSEFEDLMFDRWITGITRRLDPLFAHAYELMADGDELWKLRECTEDAWNERERICQRYLLVIVWALYLWHSRAGLIAIPSLGIADDSSSGRGRKILDTYRKVVDAAPRICRRARRELEIFWGINPSKRQRAKR
jgi:hypothetical protein